MELKFSPKSVKELSDVTPPYVKAIRNRADHPLPPRIKPSYSKFGTSLKDKIDKFMYDLEHKDKKLDIHKPEKEYYEKVLSLSGLIDTEEDPICPDIETDKKYVYVQYSAWNVFEDKNPGFSKRLESYGVGYLTGRLILKSHLQQAIETLRKRHSSVSLITEVTTDGSLVVIELSIGEVNSAPVDPKSVKDHLEEYKKTHKINRFDEKGQLIE